MSTTLKDLETLVVKNDLVPFVGAGLSYNLSNRSGYKLEGWRNLVNGILVCLKKGNYDVEYLFPLVDKVDPIKILDIIESNKSFPKTVIYDFTKEFFELCDENEFKLHKKIFKLSKKIITTNYDTAFEIAMPELRKRKAYKGRNYELTKHKDNNSALLFKLHGCYEDADSMVLFPSNYRNLYENHERDSEHSILVLKNIIMNKSILFIGVGMGDFQINNLFREIKKMQGEYNQNHYIITNKTIDSSLDFLKPIYIKEYSEIETILDNLIKYKDNYVSEDSLLIAEKEKELCEAYRKIDEMSIEIANQSRKDRLLEREAYRHFAKALEFSLNSEFQNAIEEYELACELKEDFSDAFNNWGSVLGEMAKAKEGKESEQLYQEACEKYAKAVEIKSDNHRAYSNWGAVLGNLAKAKGGKESEQLYQEACEKYAKAVKIKSDYHIAYSNWGTALGNLAKTKEGKDSEQLYQEAREKYAKAVEIKSDYHTAYFNWGADLGNLAKTKEGQDSEQLYQEACKKYAKAVEIKSDYHTAYFNWGAVLGEMAIAKTGQESEQLHQESCDKYAKAVEIKSDYHEAYYSWGTTLGNLAKAKTGQESEQLYEEAYEKLQLGLELGGRAYNLACLLALRGKLDNSFEMLEKALLNKEITVEFINNDTDWDLLRNDDCFKLILQKYQIQ